MGTTMARMGVTMGTPVPVYLCLVYPESESYDVTTRALTWTKMDLGTFG